MATAQFSAPGMEDQIALQNLERQRQYAQALRKQSMEPLPAGQMVGQHYVAPSWTQGLAKVLNAYQANNLENQADEKQIALGEAMHQRNANDMRGISEALRGTPSQSVMAPTNDTTEGGPNVTVPGKGQDMSRAMDLMMQSSNPSMNQMGQTLFTSQFMPKSPKWEKAERPDGKGGSTTGFVDVNSHDPWSTFQVGGTQSAKHEFVNGQAVNPYTTQPGLVIPKQAEAPNLGTNLVIPGANGEMVPNQPLIDARKAIGKASATNVNNNVSMAGPENAYNKHIGEGLAKESLSQVEAAKAAPEAIRVAQGIKSAIKNGAITGTGADVRLSMQKALETAGIIGEGKAATTQELMSGVSKLTLQGVRTSGLGAGNGFTDKDLAFLQSAISGSISDTPANLNRVADIAERVARVNHAKGSAILKRWSNEPSLKNITQDTTLDNLPATAQSKSAKFLGFE